MALSRVRFDDRSYDEGWVQQLLFDHPVLLPVEEFDPVFRGLFSVVRELPTNVGSVDLLCATPDGFLALVETKLWRNPQARREVVGQIIDYAKDMARWSYTDLEEAVKKAMVFPKGMSLAGLAAQHDEDFDEARFVDTVSRNLRAGRLLLLLVGDGIREEVEGMAEFLQQTPHLHYTLGLVELGLYCTDPNEMEPVYVQPMIVGRTQEVIRAVVELKVPVRPEDIVVRLPEPPPRRPGRHRISEEEFFEHLTKLGDPSVAQFAREVLAESPDHSLDIAWLDAGPCLRYVDEESGTFFTLGQIHRDGLLASTDRLTKRFTEEELPEEIYRQYLDDVASLIPGAKRKRLTSASGLNAWEQLVYGKRASATSHPPLCKLAPHKSEWFEAIDTFVSETRKAIDERR
jgi:hypothetical protein